jgi:hypothetical protein
VHEGQVVLVLVHAWFPVQTGDGDAGVAGRQAGQGDEPGGYRRR